MSPKGERRPFPLTPEASAIASSRSENIRVLITKALFEGHWLPGDRINDEELSAELRVSRISVREALSFLVEKRIVEKVHWKGYFVRKLSLEEIDSIVEVRIALEELAIRKLMQRKVPGVFEKMKEAIDSSEKLIDSSRYLEYMDRDFRFHELIYEASGNVWIKNIIGDLRVHINLLRNLSMETRFVDAARISISDHRKLLEQFIKGNKTRAIQLLRGHFETHLSNIRKTYAGGGTKSDSVE